MHIHAHILVMKTMKPNKYIVSFCKLHKINLNPYLTIESCGNTYLKLIDSISKNVHRNRLLLVFTLHLGCNHVYRAKLPNCVEQQHLMENLVK